jgi:hypothetical protein
MLLKIFNFDGNLEKGVPFDELHDKQFEFEADSTPGQPGVLPYSGMKAKLASEAPEPIRIRCHNGACRGVFGPHLAEASMVSLGQRMFGLDAGQIERDKLVREGTLKPGVPQKNTLFLLCKECFSAKRKERQNAREIEKKLLAAKARREQYAKKNRNELLYALSFWVGTRALAAKSSEKRTAEYLVGMNRICLDRTGISAEDVELDLNYENLDGIINGIAQAINTEVGFENLTCSIQLGNIFYNPIPEQEELDVVEKRVRPERWWHQKKRCFVKHHLLGTNEKIRVRHRGRGNPNAANY